MNDSFDAPSTHKDSEGQKKKKLWRNLFLLCLSISLLLIGVFWLPIKALEINQITNQPSVNLPEKGEVTKEASIPEPPPIRPANALPIQMALVNASSEKNWVYFSLAENDTVKIHDPSSLEWDLAFRRGKVITNGGITNKFGSAGAIDLGKKKFNNVDEVPTDSYIADKGTGSESENPALRSWYKYNYFTHKLTAKENVYAIRTAKGKFAKVQFLSFYCGNKETGCIKMRFVYQDNGTPNFMKSPRIADRSAES